MASNPSTGYVEPSSPVRAGIGLTTLVADSFASFFAPATSGSTLNITSYGAVSGSTATNNSVAIQSAITAASAGSEVYIPDGIWYYSTGNIPLKTGVNIRGQSKAGTILRGRSAGTLTNLFGSSVASAREGLTDIRITDLTIDRDSALGGVTQHPLRFGRGNVSDTGYTPNQRIYIARVDVSGFQKYGVMLENVKHGFVWDCDSHSATAWGGNGEGYGINISGPGSEENWIHDVRIGKTGGLMRHGVIVQYTAHNNLIEECLGILLTNDVFDCHGENEHHNEFRFNTADQAIRNHVSCGGTSPYPCYPGGIGVGENGPTHDKAGPSNWFHHNTVFGNYYSGVRIVGGTVNASAGTIVEYNELYGNVYGIRAGDLGSAPDTEIYNNHVHENSYGIQLANADNAIVRCNDSVDNSVRNLDVTSACDGATITDNNFRRGTVTNAGTNGVYTNNINTSTALPDPAPCPEEDITAIAEDSFTRSTVDGWGNADVGGTYTTSGTASGFDVNGTQGTIASLVAGGTHIARLDSVSLRDAEVLFSFVVDGVMAANHLSVYFLFRAAADTNWYAVRIYMMTDGFVDYVMVRRVSGVEVAASTAVNNAFAYTTGTRIYVRAQVSGSGTTTLRARAWTTSEPGTWAIDTTDTVGPQNAGAIGIRQFMAGTAPHTVAYDGFEVFSLTASPTCATGTGATQNATTVKVATAESVTATGTGAANNAGKTIARAAGHSSGTGAANNAGKSVSRAAGHSSGTGAATAGVPKLNTGTEYAFGVGSAPNASPNGTVSAVSTAAAGTGSAANASPQAVNGSPTEPGLTLQMGM